MQWLDLTPVLAPIQWAVVGAAATRLYMPERATLDLDIAIAAWDAAAVARRLEAGRTRDLGDITQMLGLADEAMLERVRTAFQRHSPGDIEDLESLITLGKLEMGRE